MKNSIVIDPITRIEGHAKVTIMLDDDGRVQDARFHVTQLRGFEKLCEGRPFYELPSLMARICGICPVSHLIASSKACDQILAVQIPDAAAKLRKAVNLAQIIQSHALSFFYLSSPDLLLGMDADPAKRNVFGVLEANPTLAREGIGLRKFGQQVIELMAGERIHPSWIVPGGVNKPLSKEAHEKITAMIPENMEVVQRTLDWFKQGMENYREEIRTFANFPTLFAGLVGEDGGLEHTDGHIRIVDSTGKVIADKLDTDKYQTYIGEDVETWSYTKFPSYKLNDYPDNVYRVGPLARLNIVDKVGTPKAAQEWAEFRELERGSVLSSFHYHYARLIEVLYAIEKMDELLREPDIASPRVRATAEPNRPEGVGVVEAPRGTLVHHYKVDEQGLITWANLIVATGHNNTAMNRGVLQVAKHFINGNGAEISEGMLNRVEAVIRAFDPCLSCSSHAIGQMPMHIELVTPDGKKLNEVKRG